MKSTITKFGLYAFLIASVLFLSGFLLGKNLDFNTQAIIGYSSMVISLVFVYFGIKHYRDKENNGRIAIGKAIAIGLFISLFAALGFMIIDYIYTTQINPNFQEEYLAHSLKEMKATLSVEEFQKQKIELTQQMQDYGGPTALALLMFANVIVIGFIISLISALVLQRK